MYSTNLGLFDLFLFKKQKKLESPYNDWISPLLGGKLGWKQSCIRQSLH